MSKTCGKCKIEKELGAFYVNQKARDGLRCWCMECERERHKKHQKENSKALSEQRRQYRIEHWESYMKQLNRYRVKNHEHLLEYRKQWRKNNPENCRLTNHKRNALKQRVFATLTVSQWDNARGVFNNACAYCGQTVVLQQDHFIALVKGGEYSQNNIIPACPACNYSKQKTSFFTWYPKQSFYSQKRETKILKFLNYDNGIQQLAL